MTIRSAATMVMTTSKARRRSVRPVAQSASRMPPTVPEPVPVPIQFIIMPAPQICASYSRPGSSSCQKDPEKDGTCKKQYQGRQKMEDWSGREDDQDLGGQSAEKPKKSSHILDERRVLIRSHVTHHSAVHMFFLPISVRS